MEKTLQTKRAALIAASGFEESEFVKPLEYLKNAGATVDVISLKPGKIKSWNEKEWGKEYHVDKAIDEANAGDYDAVVLPGGVMNPDQLRTNEKVVHFVSEMVDAGKVVAAVCHGPMDLN